MNQAKFQLGRGLVAALFAAATCATASAQVVDVSSTAGPGQAFYSNWATDGNASADSPVASSYNNYRKGGVNATFGLPVTADNGDGSSGTWTNVSHGGADSAPCCGNPGMFFGESASTSSYADAHLFVGANIEPGNSNIDDSTGRRNFDLRFGFTESPSDWIAGKTANSGQFDLWTGDHGSDTIYLQAQVGATDLVANGIVPTVDNGGNLVNESNQYVFINQDLMAQTGGDTFIFDERDRDRWHKNELGISTGPMTAIDNNQAGLGTFTLAGTGAANSAFDTGIAYDGNVPIDWWMEANDPGNADPALARQVVFHVQFNGVQYSQVFDPGDAANPAVPNPSIDTDVAFEDGFFDWQNAYPVFFMAPGGGANGASLTMGLTAPDVALEGDYDASGQVGQSDLDLVLLNWGDDASATGVPAGWVNMQPSGVIGQSALDGVLLNWGNAAAAGVGAVPEPTSVVLLGMGSLGLLLRRRR